MGLIIESKKNLQEIEENIDKNIVFSKLGVFSADEIEDIILAAARTEIRHLVISLGAVDEEKHLPATLRKYKNTRPNTQIIILADDREPGDETIANLVNLAIYDVIALETEELERDHVLNYSDFIHDKINNPGNFTAGERWRVAIEEEEEEELEKRPDIFGVIPTRGISPLIPSRESAGAINQEKLIGNVLIGVTSAYPGVGATFTAVQVAHFLSKFGKAAVIDLVDKDVSNRGLEYIFEDQGTTEGAYKKVGYHIIHDDKDFYDALGRGYTYIVIDFGHLFYRDFTSKYIDDLMRCHLQILVTGKSSWNIIDTSRCFSKLEQYNRKWKVLVSPVSKKELSEISRELKHPDLEIYANPYIIDPSESSEYETEEMIKIFKDYIPKHLLERKSAWRPWKR